ncbi:hypothetical protein HAX54_015379, partial [Datura stramonium]|nr:hypothetical protein [Datura stramonium]
TSGPPAKRRWQLVKHRRATDAWKKFGSNRCYLGISLVMICKASSTRRCLAVACCHKSSPAFQLAFRRS